MDAAGDRDLELQKESGDLIKEIKTKLPPLLWKRPNGPDRQPHRWAKYAKTTRLIDAIEPFQEWPQLLDAHLHWLLNHLTEAFLGYLSKHRQEYASSIAIKTPELGPANPLPRAICRIIYTLCKVRGVKVISRFLNNEPKYLEPLLRAFIDWAAVVPADSAEASATGQGESLIWEEGYVMLLWLSHLLLAPFDLETIASDTIPIPYDNLSTLTDLPRGIPQVALSVLSISLKYSMLPGKESEAATALLTRLVLRPDMQRLGVLDCLVNWAVTTLESNSERSALTVYESMGILSFLAKLGVLAQGEDLAKFVGKIFDKTLSSQGESENSKLIKSSASARKTVIKILREMTILTLALGERSNKYVSFEKASTILEDAIDHFLLALADKDTPVRFAASKALSMVTLKLDPDMASDIIDAVIGSLDENVLYEKEDGSLISRFDLQNMNITNARRNISAVDSQKWHGLMLTLGHLLFRRSPPPSLLLEILQALVLGLDFEQRASTGASIGSSVRDASCFGIWSLARNYTTKELLDVNVRDMKVSRVGDQSLLQILAVELVCAGCLDPAGNIRRGASAALQELIGRHPNTVLEGIPIVQVVDYHSVARRSRAMKEVAQDAAALGSVYWESLLGGLLKWRGIGSPDSRSRRTAASTIGELSLKDSYRSISTVLDKMYRHLSTLSLTAVEGRHGAFLALAAVVDSFVAHRMNTPCSTADIESLEETTNQVSRLWEIFDSPLKPSVESLTFSSMRPFLAAEATSRFISSLSRSCTAIPEGETTPAVKRPSDGILGKASDVLMLCVPRSEEFPMEASSEAASDLFALLSPEKQSEIVHEWFKNIHASWKSATGLGQIAALGAVFKHMPATEDGKSYIMSELIRCTGEGETMIDKRVAAVKCIITGILPYTDDIEWVAKHLRTFLDDYTTDRRGDVGSLIRVEAIDGVDSIINLKITSGIQTPYLNNLIASVARLAAEKLDKVRFKAWKCLQRFWESSPDLLPPFQTKYDHFSEVSSEEYFSQLVMLLEVDWIRPTLLQGLVTSISAGAEGVVRSSRFAIVQYINDKDENTRNELQATVFNDLLTILENEMDDDRYAIPVVDTLAFLLENCVSIDSPMLGKEASRRLFRLVQKSHFKTASIPRIEVAIKVYAILARFEDIRQAVTAKLASLILHPFPKVRLAAGENLYMETRINSMRMLDWTKSPKELKGTVDELRQVLAN